MWKFCIVLTFRAKIHDSNFTTNSIFFIALFLWIHSNLSNPNKHLVGWTLWKFSMKINKSTRPINGFSRLRIIFYRYVMQKLPFLKYTILFYFVFAKLRYENIFGGFCNISYASFSVDVTFYLHNSKCAPSKLSHSNIKNRLRYIGISIFCKRNAIKNTSRNSMFNSIQYLMLIYITNYLLNNHSWIVNILGHYIYVIFKIYFI